MMRGGHWEHEARPHMLEVGRGAGNAINGDNNNDDTHWMTMTTPVL